MKFIAKILLLIILGCSSAMAYTDLGNHVFRSDGSASDTQAAINAASDGYTVQLPAGSFTWSSSVSINNKGVHLQGAGSSLLVGYSKTSVGIGTGSKTFATQSGLPISAGQTIRAIYCASGGNWMEGTVTSYSGTSLTLNVTASSGGGTMAMWTLATAESTSVVNAFGGILLSLTEGSGQSVEVSDIHFVTGGGAYTHIGVFGGGGRPTLIHDCRFSNASLLRSVLVAVNRGILYKCSFDSAFNSGSGNGNGIDTEGIGFKNDSGGSSSWSSPSTMGAADTSGLNNYYVEDCYFAGIYLLALDFDDNSRTVVRHCIFDNSGTVAHGADTSTWGARHWEFYNNQFVFTDVGTLTYNINWWFYGRGGSGIITDNEIPALQSSQWGTKPALELTVQNLRRNAGQYACWTTYPAPHQVGQGWANGSTTTDPLYIWNNTGTAGGNNPVIADYTTDECGHGLSSSQFIVSGRDYFTGTAKPGYSKYVYPHPARVGSVPQTNPPSITQQPASKSGASGSSITLSVSASGSSLAYQWIKGGANVSGATANSLAFNPAQSSDSGSYQAVVSNPYGRVTSTVATVTITNSPPSITQQPQSVTAPAGTPVSFSVVAAGSPPLSFHWNKNGSPISGTTAATYSISVVTNSDAGNYTAVVSNGQGSTTSSVAALVVTAARVGNVYYVDASIGNDANNGSAGSPWKNCPGMSSYTGGATLTAGDTIYFNRGGTWLVGGAQGIYLTGGVTYIGDTWGSGTRATIRASTACDAGVVRFRDHATVATIFQGFDVDANKTVSSGVDFNHAYWQLMNGATKRLTNCIVRNIWSLVNSGQYKYGVIVSNHGGTGGYCENVEILNTVVHDTSRDAICLYPGDENGACRIKNVTVQGCESYNTGQDPGYGAGSGILVKGYVVDAIIDHCYTHDTKGAAMFVNGNETYHYGVGPTNVNIRYSIFTCTNANGGIRIYDGASGKDPKTINVYGNLVYNSRVTGGFYMSTDLGNVNTIRVYNNTFYNAPVYINSGSATFNVLEFRNNIVYYNGGVPMTDVNGQITSHANNLYYSPSGTLVSSKGVNYTSANLKSQFETTGSAADPLFSNANNLPTGFVGTHGIDMSPNTTGFSLQATSPALNFGASLPSPYDNSINSQARAAGNWDAGAYEAGGGSPTQPAPPTNLRVVGGF